MAAMTSEILAETIRAAFEVQDQTEQYRIETGHREPAAWQKKRAHCRGSHATAHCRGCYQKIRLNTPMVWEEDWECYVQAHRHRYWHLECHPDWINREYDRLRRRVVKRLADSGRGLGMYRSPDRALKA
jgi:hypothetical protein